MMNNRPAREKIGACLTKFSRGAAAKDKSPAGFVRIVEMLNGIKEGRDVLRFIDHYNGWLGLYRQRTAFCNQTFRVAEVFGALAGIGKIQADIGVWDKLRQERGFSRLPCAKDDMDIGRIQFLSPSLFYVSTIHIYTFIIVEPL